MNIIDLTIDDELVAPFYNGLRGNSKIRGGIDIDIAKSALQKAIRRDDFSLALCMALRLNEFIDIGGKAIRSNMINRLLVIAGEDIGIGNLKIISKVDNYVEMLRKSNDKKESELLIIKLIYLMCKAKKSRLVSHINAVYYQSIMTPSYHNKLNELKSNVIDTIRYIEINFDDVNIKREDINFMKEEDKILIKKIRWLFSNSKNNDEKMSTWFYMKSLMLSENKYKILRGFPKKRCIMSSPIFIIWNDMLEKNIEIINILYKAFLNENEIHIYLILALIVFYYENDIKCDDILVDDFFDYDFNKIINTNIDIPSYAIDKHTKKGRSIGKDTIDFAVEGSIINNSHEWNKNWNDLQEIYIDFRKFSPKFILNTNIDNILKIIMNKECKNEVDLLERKEDKEDKDVVNYDDIVDDIMSKELRKKILDEKTPRGQILTSKWKKYVYMPLDEEYVYKGEWMINNKSSKKEREKLRKLKFRFEIIKIFKASVLTGNILKDDDKLWIRYSLLSKVESKNWRLNLVFDKITEKNILVVDKKSLNILPLSNFCDNFDYISSCLFGNINLYCDFLLLYILGVGDTGLYNVLLYDGIPWIIDIDDDTTKVEFKEKWNIFGRKPGKIVVDVIEKGIENNKNDIKKYIDDIDNSFIVFKNISEKYAINLDKDDFMKKIKEIKKTLDLF
jgi:hypothetical protein